jgi:DNA repair protein RecO (recombination protein O)
MNKQTTDGIILKRVNFGEADKILTLLTPEKGKIRAIAKGVRREKSKLAGGLELLSVSQIGYISGRGDLQQIVSSRLSKHYSDIVTDFERVQLAYKAIEWIDKITEDDDNGEYYEYLKQAFEQLDDLKNDLGVIELWMRLHLLALHGNLPNLSHDADARPLVESEIYRFDIDDGCFRQSKTGDFASDNIKVWRILSTNAPSTARKVTGIAGLVAGSNQQLRLFMQNTMHIS